MVGDGGVGDGIEVQSPKTRRGLFVCGVVCLLEELVKGDDSEFADINGQG